jgi:hypothetical protein
MSVFLEADRGRHPADAAADNQDPVLAQNALASPF